MASFPHQHEVNVEPTFKGHNNSSMVSIQEPTNANKVHRKTSKSSRDSIPLNGFEINPCTRDGCTHTVPHDK